MPFYDSMTLNVAFGDSMTLNVASMWDDDFVIFEPFGDPMTLNVVSVTLMTLMWYDDFVMFEPFGDSMTLNMIWWLCTLWPSMWNDDFVIFLLFSDFMTLNVGWLCHFWAFRWLYDPMILENIVGWYVWPVMTKQNWDKWICLSLCDPKRKCKCKIKMLLYIWMPFLFAICYTNKIGMLSLALNHPMAVENIVG